MEGSAGASSVAFHRRSGAMVPNVPTPNARFPKTPKPEAAAPEKKQPAADLRPPKRSRSPNPLPMVPPPGHVGPPALPLGWVEAQDPRYDNATYYFHTRTKETSWTRPEEPLPTLPPPSRESREPPLRATPRQPQNPEIEQQLDEWVTAKRNKDYEVADGLRALLKVLRANVGQTGGRVEGEGGMWMRWGELGRGLGRGLQK